MARYSNMELMDMPQTCRSMGYLFEYSPLIEFIPPLGAECSNFIFGKSRFQTV